MAEDIDRAFHMERQKALVDLAVSTLSLLEEAPWSPQNNFLFRFCTMPSFQPAYSFRLQPDGTIVARFPDSDGRPTPGLLSMDFSWPEYPNSRLHSLANGPWDHRSNATSPPRIITYKTNCLSFPEIAREMRSIESMLDPDSFPTGTYNRLDGTSYFVEFGESLQYFFIYDSAAHESVMALADRIVEDNLWFLPFMQGLFYARRSTILRGCSEATFRRLVEKAALTETQLAALYYLLDSPNVEAMIRKETNANHIFWLAQRMKENPPESWMLDMFDRRLAKPLYDAQNRLEKSRQERRIAKHNRAIHAIIERVSEGAAQCSQCGGNSFRTFAGDTAKRGYVICRTCGLSVHPH